MMMMNEHTTRKRGKKEREREQELMGAAMARERRRAWLETLEREREKIATL
jgi:hypothetical protein